MNKTIKLELPVELIEDLDFVCKNRKLEKEDWMKFKLAFILAKEREEITNHITKRYLKSYISAKEYEEKLGYKPSKEIQKLRTFEAITPKQRKEHIKGAKNYIKEVLKKTNK